MSGRAEHGPIAGSWGKREKLTVEDDWRPGWDICMIRRGGSGLLEATANARRRYAIRSIVDGVIVKSCGEARCLRSICTFPCNRSYKMRL